MVGPDVGTKFDIELEAGNKKMIILRLSKDVYQKSETLGFNQILGDDSLIKDCLNQPEKITRNDDGKIYIRHFEHPAGMILAYINESEAQVLEEELQPDLEQEKEEGDQQ